MEKPLPPVNAESAPYWEASTEGRLVIQRCRDCGKHQFYPRLVCTACGGDALDWTEASGRGTLQTFTLIRRAVSTAFEADVPYVVGLIELDEGPTMMTNVLTGDAQALEIGQRVRVTFERRGAELSVPQFEPVD